MAAPQQTQIQPYGDLYSLRSRNDTLRYGTYSARQSPGYALADLLGAVPDAVKTYQNHPQSQPSQMETDEMSAMANMGLDEKTAKANVALAGGGIFMKNPDLNVDHFQATRGTQDGVLAKGDLQDAYAKSGLAQNDDPAAFKTFVNNYAQTALDKLKDADPSYKWAYLKQLGQGFSEMSQAHAGNVGEWIKSKSQMAAQTDAKMKAEQDLASIKEGSASNIVLNTISKGEAKSYNAFYGHDGDSPVNLTGMSLRDVLNWQRSGEYQKYGAKYEVVGRYQFKASTLAAAARAAGMDLDTTKFTPQVQDALAMTLMSEKYQGKGSKYTMENFLSGNITSSELIDHTVAPQWASVQQSNGRGRYDSNGVDHASISHNTMVTALDNYRDNYRNDPNAAAIANRRKAGITIADDPVTAAAAQNAPQELGVSTPEYRGHVANAMIDMMTANPQLADDPHVDDWVSRAGLNADQQAQVAAARTQIQQQNQHNQIIQQREQDQKTVESAEDYIRSGNQASLDGIKQMAPDVYQKLLAVKAQPVQLADADAAEKHFLTGNNFDDPEFKFRALQAYSNGQISERSYLKLTNQYNTREDAKDIVQLPGVDSYVKNLTSALPASEQDTFKGILATSMSDLKKQNGGSRPPLGDILSTIQQTYSVLAQHAEAERNRLAGNYSTSAGT